MADSSTDTAIPRATLLACTEGSDGQMKLHEALVVIVEMAFSPANVLGVGGQPTDICRQITDIWAKTSSTVQAQLETLMQR